MTAVVRVLPRDAQRAARTHQATRPGGLQHEDRSREDPRLDGFAQEVVEDLLGGGGVHGESVGTGTAISIPDPRPVPAGPASNVVSKRIGPAADPGDSMAQHGEVEFEFVPEEGGEGRFQASGNVVGTIRRLISNGEIKDAARLLGQCSDDVGDELVEDLESASETTREHLVEMFCEARDFIRAARCAERFGALVRAGELFERGYELERAAECYLEADEIELSAQARERMLDYGVAADLYLRAKRFLEAAQNLEKAGRYYDAGRLYLKLSKWSKAIEVLQKIRAVEGQFIEATILIGRVLDAAGKPELAIQRFQATATEKGLSEETLEVYYRLAAVLQKQSRSDEATDVLRKILQVDPEYRDVGERLMALPPGSDDLASEDGVVLDAVMVDTPESSEVQALAEDVEFLKKVPLFEELTKIELREFLSFWQVVGYPAGTAVIEQGTVGKKLRIVKGGRAKVVLATEAGDDKLLNHLEEGQYFGEMALVSASPTSAWVMADGDLTVLELDRETFDRILRTNDRLAAKIFRVFLEILVPRLVDAENRASRGL